MTMITTIRILLLAGIASGAVSVMSQPASPGHEISWNSEELPDGHMRVQVRNTSPVAVTAIVVEGQRCPIGSTNIHHSVKFFDSVINLYKYHPLNSGETHEFIMFGPNPPRDKLRLKTVTVRAALFEDGSTWGDPEWISILTGNRSALYNFDSALVGALLEAKLHPSASTNIFQVVDNLKQQHLQQAQSQNQRIVIESQANAIETQVRLSGQALTQLQNLDSVRAVPPPVDDSIKQLNERVRALQIATEHQRN